MTTSDVCDGHPHETEAEIINNARRSASQFEGEFPMLNSKTLASTYHAASDSGLIGAISSTQGLKSS